MLVATGSPIQQSVTAWIHAAHSHSGDRSSTPSPPPCGQSDRLLGGPQHPYHGRFNPGAGIPIGYDDTLTIELAEFLGAVAQGVPGRASLAAAAAVARVQQAVARSWDSGTWESVAPV